MGDDTKAADVYWGEPYEPEWGFRPRLTQEQYERWARETALRNALLQWHPGPESKVH